MPDAPFTLMTVHAHPDDETISTGGVMAKAVADEHRVVLVTCTDGAMGEIVIPERDTPEEHRRLAATRAFELEAAMADLGVTEWENLGYRDSDMMGREANVDPRSFWQADLDEAIGRLVWLVRRYRPHVMTTYNDFGGYGHPDHRRPHVGAVGAFARAGDPSWYASQLSDGGLEPWTPLKLYETAIPSSVRQAMRDRLKDQGRSWGEPPDDATNEERAEFEERMRKMLVPDEVVTTWVNVGPFLDRKFSALMKHATQMSPEHPFLVFGVEGWREFWPFEAFVLHESRVETVTPESDLFAGLS